MFWYYRILSIHLCNSINAPFNRTAQKKKFSVKDFFGKCDQIYRKLKNQSHLLKKPLVENLLFCSVCYSQKSSFLKLNRNNQNVQCAKNLFWNLCMCQCFAIDVYLFYYISVLSDFLLYLYMLYLWFCFIRPHMQHSLCLAELTFCRSLYL